MTSRDEEFHNSRSAHLFGAGEAALAHKGPTMGAPFSKARGAGALGRAYDMDRVRAAAVDRNHPVTEVDPRGLSQTQPSVMPDAVRHYMSPDYHETGETYADRNGKLGHHTAGNRVPLIYETEDGKERVIMAGHHRATAALLSGQMLAAKVVRGPWRTRSQTR